MQQEVVGNKAHMGKIIRKYVSKIHFSESPQIYLGATELRILQKLKN